MADDSYIVRIYRRDPKNSRLIAGTVEEVGVEEKRGFDTFEELRGILSDTGRPRGPRVSATERAKGRGSFR